MPNLRQNIADKSPEVFAAILASKCAPGVVESFCTSAQTLEKTEKLVDFLEAEGKGAWQPEPHLEYLCEKLEQVAAGNIQRLIVTMPPRHGKSMVCSKKFPPWYLRKYPDNYIMITSYSADLAFDFSRVARNTISDGREFFPNIAINQTARAVKHWMIDGKLGGLIAAGVGGPITGRGAHVAIIDDPFKIMKKRHQKQSGNQFGNGTGQHCAQDWHLWAQLS